MDKRGQRKQFRAKNAVYFLTYVMVLGLCLCWIIQSKYYDWAIYASEQDLTNVKAAMAPVQELNQKYTEVEAELEAFKAKYPDPKREDVEKYVRLIFGPDANAALAISHHECGYTNKNYPKCHLKSGVEHSVGLFQINLYNSKQWIHAGRIPGVTMEQKVLWLENPFNNTLYAYWVFKTSGWNPWSAYTNGAYLNDPLMKK